MDILKKLRETVKKSKDIDFKKRTKRVKKRKKRFLESIRKNDVNESELFEYFDSIVSLVSDKPRIQYRAILKAPLLVAVLDILLTHLDITEFFLPNLAKYHSLFLMSTFLEDPEKGAFDSKQDFNRYVTTHQVAFLNEGYDGDREKFVESTLKVLVHITMSMIDEIGGENAHTIRITVQWLDAMLALSTKVAIPVLTNWTNHIVELNQIRPTADKKVPRAHIPLFRKQVRHLTSFYGKCMTTLFNMETEESTEVEESVMEELKETLLSNYRMPPKIVASAVRVFSIVFSSYKFREVEAMILSLLHEEPRYEIRLSCLWVAWNFVFGKKVSFNYHTKKRKNVKDTKKNEKARKAWIRRLKLWFSKILISSKYDPSNNVRYRATRLILGHPFEERGYSCCWDDDDDDESSGERKKAFSFHGSEEGLKKYVKQKAQDLDDRCRVFTLEWVKNRMKGSESQDDDDDDNVSEDRFGNIRFGDSEVMEMVLLGVDDESKKVRKVSTDILRKMFKRAGSKKENDMLQLLRKMSIKEMMIVKEVIKEFIEDIMDKLIVRDEDGDEQHTRDDDDDDDDNNADSDDSDDDLDFLENYVGFQDLRKYKKIPDDDLDDLDDLLTGN